MIEPFDVWFSHVGPDRSLPEGLRRIYGSDLAAPTSSDVRRPALTTNFVVSHDGRISFELPGQRGGNPISGSSRHDHWLMELLRARADAILLGTATLRSAPRHAWRPGELFADAAFAALRAAAGRRPWPDLVILTRSGILPQATAAFNAARRIFILTTADARLSDLPPQAIVLREATADGLIGQLRQLRTDYGITDLLSEGGGRTYAGLLAAGAVDDVFITRSPLIVGNPAAPAAGRPGLVEGISFTPQSAPRLQLLSLRRADQLLFEHLRVVPPPATGNRLE